MKYEVDIIRRIHSETGAYLEFMPCPDFGPPMYMLRSCDSDGKEEVRLSAELEQWGLLAKQIQEEAK